MKKVTINQGIPGSGKSTATQKLVEGLPIGDYVWCSADTHHINSGGVYDYKPEEAGNAHSACLLKFEDAVRNDIPLVIVDNTNIYKYEMSPYVLLARAYKYDILITRYDCSLENSMARNQHSVPDEVILMMWKDLEEPLHRWGDFIIINTDQPSTKD